MVNYTCSPCVVSRWCCHCVNVFFVPLSTIRVFTFITECCKFHNVVYTLVLFLAECCSYQLNWVLSIHECCLYVSVVYNWVFSIQKCCICISIFFTWGLSTPKCCITMGVAYSLVLSSWVGCHLMGCWPAPLPTLGMDRHTPYHTALLWLLFI